MFSPLTVKGAIFILCIILFSPPLLFTQIYDNDENIADNNSILFNRKMTNNLIDSNFINSLPLRTTKDFLKYLPGVIEHQGKFHLNGSRYDELDYSADGFSILDHFSGEQLIDIPKYALKSIGVGSNNVINRSNTINYELKTGSNEFKYSLEHSTDNLGLNSTNDFYEGQHRLGSYWYGYNETNFNVQGPIVKDQLTFFANANYQFMRDRNPQLYSGINDLQLFGLDNQGNVDEENVYLLNMPKGIVYGNSIQSYNILGKLSYTQDDFSLDITGVFENKLQDAPRNHILDYFNKRLGKIEDNAGFFSLAAKHQISNMFWYNINASYSFKYSETYDEHLKDNFWAYGDSVANADAGIFWERTEEEIERWNESGIDPYRTRFIQPTDYYLNGFSFSGINAIPTNYSKSAYQSITFNSNFNYSLFKNNIFSLGFDINQMLIRKWETIELQTSMAYSFHTSRISDPDLDPFLIRDNILINSGVNNIGYNRFGNEVNSGLDKAPKPLIASAYICNEYQSKFIRVRAEIRFARFTIDNYLFKNEFKIQDSFSQYGLSAEPIMEGFKKSSVHTKINPTFIIDYQLSEDKNIKIKFENYSTLPRLNDIYHSQLNFNYANYYSNYFSNTIYNNDLKPVSTQNTQIEYKQFWKNWTINLHGFYKKIENQTAPKMAQGPLYGYDFSTISNDASSSILGLLLISEMKRTNGLSLLTSLSIQSARGTISHYYFSNNPWVYPLRIENFDKQLEFEKSFSAFILLEYLFSTEQHKSVILNNLKISSVINYQSGHPYSIASGNIDMESNPLQRKIYIYDLNTHTTPSTFQLNLKVEKSIRISDYLSLNIFIYAINLFGNENVRDVFLRTGSPKSDGVISDEGLRSQTEIEKYGDKYAELYRLTNINYNPKNGQQTMFGEPRQIIVGINLNL